MSGSSLHARDRPARGVAHDFRRIVRSRSRAARAAPGARACCRARWRRCAPCPRAAARRSGEPCVSCSKPRLVELQQLLGLGAAARARRSDARTAAHHGLVGRGAVARAHVLAASQPNSQSPTCGRSSGVDRAAVLDGQVRDAAPRIQHARARRTRASDSASRHSRHCRSARASARRAASSALVTIADEKHVRAEARHDQAAVLADEADARRAAPRRAPCTGMLSTDGARLVALRAQQLDDRLAAACAARCGSRGPARSARRGPRVGPRRPRARRPPPARSRCARSRSMPRVRRVDAHLGGRSHVVHARRGSRPSSQARSRSASRTQRLGARDARRARSRARAPSACTPLGQRRRQRRSSIAGRALAVRPAELAVARVVDRRTLGRVPLAGGCSPGSSSASAPGRRRRAARDAAGCTAAR